MLKEYNRVLNDRELPLKEIIDIQQWQKIQDNFSAVTEVGLRLVNSDGSLITAYSRQPQLCRKLLQDSPAKDRICGTCLPTFLHGKAVVDKNLSFVCEAGLHNFIAPLELPNGKILAYLVVGPVILVMRPSKEEYRLIAQESGIDFDDFWNALLEIRTISFHCAQSLVELVKDVAEYTIKSACQNTIQDKRAIVAAGKIQLTKLLDALLDVAFEISKADVGSVMSFNKASDELTITASRGIVEDIVRTARVKLGTGISGIAAKEGKTFLINTASRDNRLAPYLNRPVLGSSMVIPLKIRDEVVAVMNIAALAASEVSFSEDHVKTMRKLADLATVAINL